MAKQLQAMNVCILSGQTTIQGNIITAFDVHVDAIVHGNIQAGGKVVISAKAEVHETIQATSITVAGHIYGDVEVETSLSCQSTARIFGDISCQRITVEEGAVLHGGLQMDPAAVKHSASEKKVVAEPIKAHEPAKTIHEVTVKTGHSFSKEDTADAVPGANEHTEESASRTRNFKLNMNLW